MKIEEIGLFLLAVLLYISIKRLVNRRKRYLSKRGISVKAEVVRVDETGITIDSVGTDRVLKDVVLRIAESPLENRRAVLRQSFDANRVPELNEILIILVDPDNPDNASIISY